MKNHFWQRHRDSFPRWIQTLRYIALVFLTIVACLTHTEAQLSVIDHSFKVGSGTDAAVESLIVQQDGRVLVGGDFTVINAHSNSFLARLNADGSLDNSFNPPSSTDGNVFCMARQADDKILVGGAFHKILGSARHGLARLFENGSRDFSFNANSAFSENTTIQAIALQSDQKILVSYYLDGDETSQRIARLDTTGLRDGSWSSIDVFGGYVYTLLPLPDGTTLAGVNPRTDFSLNLVRLKRNGSVDHTFRSGLDTSSVFRLLRKPDGHILVAGLLFRNGAPQPVPLLQLNSNLQWDDSFQPDAFTPSSSPNAFLTALRLQPDGKILCGGDFETIGGYARRGIARLTAAGHVDPCFEPGLGLGRSPDPGAVRTMGQQSDGRIILGGAFRGAEGASEPENIARLLPNSGCNMIRTYLISPGWFAIGIFPPGGTNILETSQDLRTWQEAQRGTNAYIYSVLGDISQSNSPVFFRAKQER